MIYKDYMKGGIYLELYGKKIGFVLTGSFCTFKKTIPKIKEFSNLELQVNLAISLHGATNEVRNKIMPVNKVYNIEALIDTIKEYIAKTNRRVTIEYVMLNMINDTENDAINLANLLKGLNVYVNLIPYNETKNIGFKKKF